MTDPHATSQRIKTWLTEEALPLWATKGLDKERGGFHEILSFEGEPDPSRIKRFRVQCRQIYVYAYAHQLGLMTNALAPVQEGLDFIQANGWSENRPAGGWIHLFEPNGGIRDNKADTYDHAFALLGFALLYRANASDVAKTLLMKTVSFMEQELAHPASGWKEGLPHTLPRRQNPHMHCFEAFMAAFEATSDQNYLSHARDVYNLFTDHFFDQKRSALLEYFEEDFSPIAVASEQRIEPGHQMEWVWLLREYERLSGESVGDYPDRLYETGYSHGLNSDLGLLIDELDTDLSRVKPTMRCWVQTEYLKATLAQFVAHKEQLMLTRSIDIVDRIFDLYLSGTIAGGWRDQFDGEGNNLSTDVPASTFYHLFCAFTYAMSVYDSL